jgi:hypothetical protein
MIERLTPALDRSIDRRSDRYDNVFVRTSQLQQRRHGREFKNTNVALCGLLAYVRRGGRSITQNIRSLFVPRTTRR